MDVGLSDRKVPGILDGRGKEAKGPRTTSDVWESGKVFSVYLGGNRRWVPLLS